MKNDEENNNEKNDEQTNHQQPVEPEKVKFILQDDPPETRRNVLRWDKTTQMLVFGLIALMLICGLIVVLWVSLAPSESRHLSELSFTSLGPATSKPEPTTEGIVEIIAAPHVPRTDSNSILNGESNSNSVKNSAQNTAQKTSQKSSPQRVIQKSQAIDTPKSDPKAPPSPPVASKPFAPYSVPKATKVDNEMEKRRNFVKSMFVDSWSSYRSEAWGHEALRPVTNTTYSKAFGDNSGLSIVTSMSTLWTMGLMDEFEQGKVWIQEKLDLSKIDRDVRVFDTVAHYVGGLLSCYALTGDELFLKKALEVAKIVEPAFNTPSGIPYEKIQPNTGTPNDEYPHLSYATGFLLDFNYLSDVSSQAKYREMMSKIYKLLHENSKNRKLYFNVININGQFQNTYSSPFSESSEFYIHLVKSYIQSNRKDVQSLQMYKDALEAMEAVKIIQDGSHAGLPNLYFAQGFNSRTNATSSHMEYSGCYLGAALSMASNAQQQSLESNKLIDFDEKQMERDRIKHHWQLGESITETCYQASVRSKTGLGPTSFYLHGNYLYQYITTYKNYNEFYLSPELAESYFILWRLSHNPKYRDYAWKMAQAIHQHCRTESGGYSGVVNVNEIPTESLNHQSPLFLSATLKYLYLTFADDSELPLEQWVFNSVGHPLPICGKNPANPVKNCEH